MNLERMSERTHTREGEVARHVGASARVRHDKYVHHTHEMSYATGEASARLLIRVVPLVYGVLLGWQIGVVWLGLLLGALLSVGLDVRMGAQSLFSPLLRRLVTTTCPVLSFIVAGISKSLTKAHLPVPSSLRAFGCGGA